MSFSESPQDTFFSKKNSINCKGKTINLDEHHVMGILNLTPDSFFDGGNFDSKEKSLMQAEKMLNDGATFIDIGGYSSRPGALPISEEEELKRVIPIIELLTKEFPEIIISIDTFRSNVASSAIAAGACIINDISAGDLDKEMLNTVAKLNAPYIMMHMQGTPETMQLSPEYKIVTKEVVNYIEQKVKELLDLGHKDIIIDPGFGFGKNLEHNYELLNNLELLKELNLPILVGVSRKSMINKVLGTTPPTALNGTSVLNTIALGNGANILRVHDVKEAVEVVKLHRQLKGL